MPSPGGQFFSDEYGDIEDYFISDYQLIDQYIGDQLWTWGVNDNGQLGTDDSTTRAATPVTTFTGGTNWKSVACGGLHNTAIKTDGTLWLWGNSNNGRLGHNSGGGIIFTPITTSSGGTNWKTGNLSSNAASSGAIKTDGTLWIWGFNNSAQLGINDTADRSNPVTTFAGGTNWKSVALGFAFTTAIKTDGTLWTWGRNTEGQLGINATTNRSTPVTTFTGGNNWKSVACGGDHIAAIKTDGTLWTWGSNTNGQLGINNTTQKNTPVTTRLGGTDWKQVSCGQFHTAAIKTDGTLWNWGRNAETQLGINNSTIRSTPVTTFSGGTTWKSVSCAYRHTMAIKTDGTLWLWGRNDVTQMGINVGGGTRSTPVTTFLGGTNWKSVSGGGQYTTAVQSGLNVDLS